jgi:hypothetical protein
MTDPALRGIMVEEALAVPSPHRTLLGLHGCLPTLPADVRAWRAAGTGLIDSLVGLWLAPVTTMNEGEL